MNRNIWSLSGVCLYQVHVNAASVYMEQINCPAKTHISSLVISALWTVWTVSLKYQWAESIVFEKQSGCSHCVSMLLWFQHILRDLSVHHTKHNMVMQQRMLRIYLNILRDNSWDLMGREGGFKIGMRAQLERRGFFAPALYFKIVSGPLWVHKKIH